MADTPCDKGDDALHSVPEGLLRALQTRDEIIEECAAVCERGTQQGDYADADHLAGLIRALKNAAPQAGTGLPEAGCSERANAASSQSPAVAAHVVPPSASAIQSIPSQCLASSEARPGNTPDEPCHGETHQRRVAPRPGSGEGVSQADSRERPASPSVVPPSVVALEDAIQKIMWAIYSYADRREVLRDDLVGEPRRIAREALQSQDRYIREELRKLASPSTAEASNTKDERIDRELYLAAEHAANRRESPSATEPPALECPACGGEGHVFLGHHTVSREMAIDAGDRSMEGMDMGPEYGNCPECNGTGRVINDAAIPATPPSVKTLTMPEDSPLWLRLQDLIARHVPAKTIIENGKLVEDVAAVLNAAASSTETLKPHPDTTRMDYLQSTVYYSGNTGPSHEATATIDDNFKTEKHLIEAKGDLRKACDAAIAERASVSATRTRSE